MNMKNILKKICICGASLMMVSSIGAGINNVSAKKVHRHARTHRLATSNHALYKLGEKDNYKYISLSQYASYKKINKLRNEIIERIISLNFNKSYVKGFAPKMPANAGNNMGMGTAHRYFAVDAVASDAKKLARHHHLNSHNVYAYFHKDTRPKYTKRHAKKGHKNTKKYRKAKVHHNKKQVAKHHTIKRNRKLKKNTKKHMNKHSNKTSAKVTKHSSQSHDETDGGKYYSWNQLQDVMNSEDVAGGYESDSTDQKIKGTIMHNLNSYNWKQDDALLSNDEGAELNSISPDLFNKVNNAYGFSYGMRKVL